MYLNKKINNKIFTTLSNISKKLKYKTYIIGGFVRNLFIKNKITISDIDIVTTGNSVILAKKFSFEILTKNIYIYKRFKTAIVKYKNISIEFVSTRKEYYNIYNNKPNI
ncbi:MAG: tRNA nucleotidyltransferase, partial [Candidatus Shikimatogenerans sp. JK-2022]|nr:tRNA nucleotidyltransferase [Candidatus Shikimatogenerans bostrichidophilus]